MMISKFRFMLPLACLGLAAFLMAPAATAKPNCDANPNNPNCSGGGGGGGGGSVSDVDIDVQWASPTANPGFQESATRHCILVTSGSTSGGYKCETVNGGSVTYSVAGLAWQQTARKGDPDLCSVFDVSGGVPINPSSDYHVGWDGDCTGSCTVRILNVAYGNEVSAIPGVGLVNIQAFAEVVGASELNPFAAGTTTLDVDEVVINFKGEGTNKTIASCRYPNIDTELNPIVFQVTPAAP